MPSKLTDSPDATVQGVGEYVSRDEALVLLGVKRSTLYTYVSRGWIRSIPRRGARGHLFSRQDVERLRVRSQAHAGAVARAETAMRWGEPVIATGITEITPSGPRYRGRDALELARLGYSFEAVAQLLWTGVQANGRVAWDVPPSGFSPDRVARSEGLRRPPDDILKVFAAMVLALGRIEDAGDELQTGATIPAGQRILKLIAGCCGYLASRGRFVVPQRTEPLAATLARAFGVQPRPEVVDALNCALVLTADHELSPFAFTARIAASFGADLYACMAAGLCAHSGTQTAGSTDELEKMLVGANRAILRQKLDVVEKHGFRMFGFSHPLYPQGDPRARMIIKLAQDTAPARGPVQDLFWFLEQVEEQCHIQPGIGVALVALARTLGLPRHSALAIWSLGRSAGAIAHVIEQRLAGYVLRPRARYTS